MTPEQDAEAKSIATDGYNHWKANASDEAKLNGEKGLKKFQEDPSH